MASMDGDDGVPELGLPPAEDVRDAKAPTAARASPSAVASAAGPGRKCCQCGSEIGGVDPGAEMREMLAKQFDLIHQALGVIEEACDENAAEVRQVKLRIDELISEKRASPRQLIEGRVCAGVANSQLSLDRLDRIAKKIEGIESDLGSARQGRIRIEAEIDTLHKSQAESRGLLALLTESIQRLSADLAYALGDDEPASQAAGPASQAAGPSVTKPSET